MAVLSCDKLDDPAHSTLTCAPDEARIEQPIRTPRKPPMPSKRSHSSAFHRNGSSNGSVSPNQGPSKRAHTDSASSSPGPTVDTRESSVDQSPIQVYIISAKLLPVALEDLVNLVENNATSQRDRAGACNLELTLDLDHADVIVTAVHTRPRLERHVRWEVAVRGSLQLSYALR